MRDYLEELMDGAGALLEELRKAERGLSGLTSSEGGLQPPSEEEPRSAYQDGEAELFPEKKIYQMNNTVYNETNLREISEKQGGQIVNQPEKEEDKPKPLRRQSEEREDGETGHAPLEVQLEQLERAVASTDGTDFRRKDRMSAREGASDQMGRGAIPALDTEEAEKAGIGGLGPLSASGREGDWVEQADQAFRRDSRRYDGGFYLY